MSDQRQVRSPWVVGVSGASGTPYAASVLRALFAAGEAVDLVVSRAARLTASVLRALFAAGEAVDLVVSRAARLTILDETGISFRDAHWREDLAAWLGTEPGDVRYWSPGDFAAGPSSGSYPAKGMLVVPATTGAVAGIALGLSKDLLQRTASVTLKERRPLVVCLRETPLNGVTLKHLVELDAQGAVVLPASPGFYAGGSTARELVDFVAGRVLDAVGVPHTLYRRWEGELGAAAKAE